MISNNRDNENFNVALDFPDRESAIAAAIETSKLRDFLDAAKVLQIGRCEGMCWILIGFFRRVQRTNTANVNFQNHSPFFGFGAYRNKGHAVLANYPFPCCWRMYLHSQT